MSDQPDLFKVEPSPTPAGAPLSIHYSAKQEKIMREIVDKGSITLDRAIELVGDQYHNQSHHTGNILRRLMKRGRIERLKRGVYVLPKK